MDPILLEAKNERNPVRPLRTPVRRTDLPSLWMLRWPLPLSYRVSGPDSIAGTTMHDSKKSLINPGVLDLVCPANGNQ